MNKKYILMAIELAKEGIGLVEPNPYVGCVIVKKGKVIGKGAHRIFGGMHAEIEALKTSETSPKNATMYVTLEPCCHKDKKQKLSAFEMFVKRIKKTLPCVPDIIRSGIKKVVIAMRDPNPRVNGKGIKRLKRAGIKVVEGVCEKEARDLNKAYIKSLATGLPYVTAKWAMSIDGKIATSSGDSKFISSAETRKFTKELRKNFQAIVVGINTVLKDNPFLLTTAEEKEVLFAIRNDKNLEYEYHKIYPIRIVFDSYLRLPLDSNLIKTISKSELIIATTQFANKRKKMMLEKAGARVVTMKADKNKNVPIKKFFRLLYKEGINNILIEGGGELIGDAFKHSLVDSIIAVVSPKIIGGKKAPTPVEGDGFKKISQSIGLKNLNLKKIGGDYIISADIKR